MKKKIFYLLFLLSLAPALMAQDEEEETVPKKPKSELADKFFLAFTTSTYTDLIISPLKFHLAPTGNFTPGDSLHPSVPTYKDIPFQSAQYNIISLGMEFRLNLKELDDNTAITLAVPVSFGIGTTSPIDDIKVRGVSGFGSLQIPITLKLFLGNGSTYKTKQDFGFNIGGGLEVNKIGLINLGGESNQYNSFFALPCLTAGILFMRGDSPMEVNFKYGFGRLKTQDVNGQGDPLLDNTGIPYQRAARGQTLKLSFIYLMNY